MLAVSANRLEHVVDWLWVGYRATGTVLRVPANPSQSTPVLSIDTLLLAPKTEMRVLVQSQRKQVRCGNLSMWLQCRFEPGEARHPAVIFPGCSLDSLNRHNPKL